MRCARCGRRRRRRTGRGPDGRLIFNWCDDCLADLQLQALGLRPLDPADQAEAPREGGDLDLDDSVVPRPGGLGSRERSLALRTLGFLLVIWGLILELVGAGAILGLRPRDDGFGPSALDRLGIFAAAGVILSLLGVCVGLSSLDRRVRARAIARGVETLAAGLGLLALVLGIVFHESSRDPWIVAGVVLAVAISWVARRWSRPRRRGERPIHSG